MVKVMQQGECRGEAASMWILPILPGYGSGTRMRD